MIYLLIVFSFFLTVQKIHSTDLNPSEALRKELKRSDAENISPQTHPLLYSLIEKLAEKVHMSVPEYVTLIKKKIKNNKSGVMVAESTLLGDVHISEQLLKHASWQEAEAILALAMADKEISRPHKLLMSKIIACVLVPILFTLSFEECQKIDDLSSDGAINDNENSNIRVTKWVFSLFALPVVYRMISNKLQKEVDLEAARLVGAEVVKKSLIKIKKIQEAYCKKSTYNRFLSALGLEKLIDILTYPLRSYTIEERLKYLS